MLLEFGILAKVASRSSQQTGSLQDLPDITHLLEVCSNKAKKSLRTISVDSLIRQFEISAAIRPVGSTAVL